MLREEKGGALGTLTGSTITASDDSDIDDIAARRTDW